MVWQEQQRLEPQLIEQQPKALKQQFYPPKLGPDRAEMFAALELSATADAQRLDALLAFCAEPKTAVEALPVLTRNSRASSTSMGSQMRIDAMLAKAARPISRSVVSVDPMGG